MSEIHKALLRKVKKSEQAFGLTLLSEETEVKYTNTSKCEEYTTITPDADDTKLYDEYEKYKMDTFPVSEVYYDRERDVEFQTYYKAPDSPNSSVLICHHGAGSSSMTFAKLASTLNKVTDLNDNAPGLFTFDMRGHGKSSIVNDFEMDTLIEDFKFVMVSFFQRNSPQGSIYLVGHSLGGSVVTKYLLKYPENGYNIKGLVMVDIVEETAVKSLIAMPSYIDRMPKSFNSYKEAINWHIKKIGLLSNYSSAKISVPDLLRKNVDGKLVWRTDLALTKPYWDSWFSGLSENFIDCGKQKGIAKLLMLSGHETLDTNLIIGQMQGKYQLIVFNNISEAGHFIHEDIPDKIAISLIDFVKRNDSPDEYMRQELGFVPKWGGKINN